MAEAGSSPTRTTVRPGCTPFARSSLTACATSPRTFAEIALPSMIMGRGVYTTGRTSGSPAISGNARRRARGGDHGRALREVPHDAARRLGDLRDLRRRGGGAEAPHPLGVRVGARG